LSQHTIEFNRPCLSVEDGIPIFMRRDAYVDTYERISQDHLAHADATGHNPFMDETLWRETEDATADQVARLVQTGSRLLDIGVGLGRLLGRFPQCERYGIDISLPYLRRTSSMGIRVGAALIEDIPFPDRSFDVLVCTDVLEHVLDLNLACREMLRVLRDDGHLVIRVPYREDLSGYLHPDFPYQFAHLRNFDEHSLRLLATRIMRCTVNNLTTCGMMPTADRWRHPWLAPGSRLLRPMLALRRRFPRCYRRLCLWGWSPTEIICVARKSNAVGA
jgi:SAM-dependent methyltransferase